MGIGIKEKSTFKTYDQMLLDKLEEIGKSTLLEWAKAMGYDYSNTMAKFAKNLSDRLIITRYKSRRVKYYEVKK
ncbi:hypothetical protein LCGC14_0224570 [marine sediment metagenome]|uniref:Uncharacterized protein n=1 Tax=marine sediment metagenome TaxID=412755 RepID=A0A0F9XG57_9ZZZZ|nr:hypothetical protein [bacterium]